MNKLYKIKRITRLGKELYLDNNTYDHRGALYILELSKCLFNLDRYEMVPCF